jgi:hypothetical protein
MSAGKHNSRVGGRKRDLTEEERVEKFAWRLSRDVGRACDDYQLRVNGYVTGGFRQIINTSVLKTQSEKPKSNT